ncbi:MAG: NAD(+)/NADH kinase [Clostridiales bacterium]|nr:NAD(+)/NADH kinase [Clostridiales bacterium]
MDRFLLITNEDKDRDNSFTKKVASYIQSSGRQATCINIVSLADNKEAYKDAECALVLGGDGSLIHAATNLMPLDIPILGINLGTVGFLTEVEKDNIAEALNKLFADEFDIEKRIMVRGDIRKRSNHNNYDNNKSSVGYALNDIVLTQKGFSRIISLKIYVNDMLVDDFRGDGVIIATPTGSTAYNMSAGGPIIIPNTNAIVITPICPHTLSPKSIVVSSEDTIKIIIKKSKSAKQDNAIATFDGQKIIELGLEDQLIINKAQYETKLIRLNQTGIFEILRSKLINNGDNV